MEQAIAGREPVIRRPWLLSPGPNGRSFRAPMLGQHNDRVFQEMLGLSDREIAELRSERIVL